MKNVIFSLISAAFVLIGDASPDVTKEKLCKKWYLQKYEIFWIDFPPEENEKNDYIHFSPDMTYTSVDEGVFTSGQWKLHESLDYFTLYEGEGEGLKFFIEDLSKDHLVVTIDIDELDGIDFHFTTNK